MKKKNYKQASLISALLLAVLTLGGLTGCAKFVTEGQNRQLEISILLKGTVDPAGAYYLVLNKSGQPVHLPLVETYLNAPDWTDTYNYDLAKPYIDYWDSYLVLRNSFYYFYAGPFGAAGETARYPLDGWDSSQPLRLIYQLDLDLPLVDDGTRVYFNVITVRANRTIADTLNGDFSLTITPGETITFRDADGDVGGEGSQDAWDIIEGTLRVL